MNARYVYCLSHVPKPGEERLRLNLRVYGGAVPADGQAVGIVVESFAFAP